MYTKIIASNPGVRDNHCFVSVPVLRKCPSVCMLWHHTYKSHQTYMYVSVQYWLVVCASTCTLITVYYVSCIYLLFCTYVIFANYYHLRKNLRCMWRVKHDSWIAIFESTKRGVPLVKHELSFWKSVPRMCHMSNINFVFIRKHPWFMDKDVFVKRLCCCKLFSYYLVKTVSIELYLDGFMPLVTTDNVALALWLNFDLWLTVAAVHQAREHSWWDPVRQAAEGATETSPSSHRE